MADFTRLWTLCKARGSDGGEFISWLWHVLEGAMRSCSQVPYEQIGFAFCTTCCGIGRDPSLNRAITYDRFTSSVRLAIRQEVHSIWRGWHAMWRALLALVLSPRTHPWTHWPFSWCSQQLPPQHLGNTSMRNCWTRRWDDAELHRCTQKLWAPS